MIRRLVFACVLLALAAPAAAQTGPCPTGTAVSVIPIGGVVNVCVAPSLSAVIGHNAVDPDTTLPVTVRYDILLLNDGDPLTGTAQATINIGKPTLNSDGVFWAVLPAAQVPTNRRFRATAVAIGQPDAAPSPRSAFSNPFVVKNPPSPAAPIRTAVP